MFTEVNWKYFIVLFLVIGVFVGLMVLRLFKKLGYDVLQPKVQIVAFLLSSFFWMIPLIYEPYGVLPGIQKLFFVGAILLVGIIKIFAGRRLIDVIHNNTKK